MSNYTDLFFEMPIKVYDGFSLKKVQEEEETSNEPVEAAWVTGKVRLPYTDILSWYDGFSKGRDPKDVVENGFDFTIVETRSMGDYVCIWKKERFEAKLNEHVNFIRENNLSVPVLEGKKASGLFSFMT